MIKIHTQIIQELELILLKVAKMIVAQEKRNLSHYEYQWSFVEKVNALLVLFSRRNTNVIDEKYSVK